MIATLDTPITTPGGPTTLGQAADQMIAQGTSRVFASDTTADTLISLRTEFTRAASDGTTPREVAILAAWYLVRLRQLNADFLDGDMTYEAFVGARETLRAHLFH